MKSLCLLLLIIFTAECNAQELTAASMFLKKDKIQLDSVSSTSGNLFNKLGHHGPAIENQWLGYRLYFDKRTAIDVYSKANPGLELSEKKWYPSKKDQLAGWGADYYKVGKSIGLAGVRLWDGDKIVALHPVLERSAKVFSGRDSSYMELLSEGVLYKQNKVDILIRVTVFPYKREARVEALSLNGIPVQFITGINYFENLETNKQEGFIATWGIHPEDVAAEQVEVGAAILFNENDIESQLSDDHQYLLISKPCERLETWITSANAREQDINSFEKFIGEIDLLKAK